MLERASRGAPRSDRPGRALPSQRASRRTSARSSPVSSADPLGRTRPRTRVYRHGCGRRARRDGPVLCMAGAIYRAGMIGMYVRKHAHSRSSRPLSRIYLVRQTRVHTRKKHAQEMLAVLALAISANGFAMSSAPKRVGSTRVPKIHMDGGIHKGETFAEYMAKRGNNDMPMAANQPMAPAPLPATADTIVPAETRVQDDERTQVPHRARTRPTRRRLCPRHSRPSRRLQRLQSTWPS